MFAGLRLTDPELLSDEETAHTVFYEVAAHR
jgi:hypothetical protein